MINTAEITGLILSGGQGRRIGGIDKGLQHYQRCRTLPWATGRHADGLIQAQPVFCLLRASLHDRLARDLQSGARPVERWIKRQAHATVVSEDATPFVNANTLQELGNL